MSRGPHAISADFVFDGDVLHRDTAVIVDNGWVAALAPRSELPAAVPVSIVLWSTTSPMMSLNSSAY